MALKLLPLAVQSKFSASTRINSFKTAIEELVYNAFDADSTCIAIRIHTQENFIQVVDNGHGVAENDFNLLGQRHSTSKYEDSITSKSNRKYGHCGQALANIIEVSESVKITSKCKNSEEAFTKHFFKGKSQDCLVTTARPSIGTTVEIKGFLYNMTIQRKAIKTLQELQRIKMFLEQMSLAHCNTSISLRNNIDNEIIFKIHKNRDIYHTFSLLMDYDKSSFQELQVEKNQYKVTGYIQKSDTQSHGYQWIYVNKRFIDNSNLHKIMNQNLIKLVPMKKITKVKNHNNEEDGAVTKNKLHDYFIFITCPCNDFDIISNPKQSMLEFKNLNQIEKLLEKLIFLFTGSTTLVNKSGMPTERMKIAMADDQDTRNQVKQIMNKVLGNHHKKINGSQLHNGVKGKVIKRKIKKNIKEKFAKLKPNEYSILSKRHEFHKAFKQNDEPFKNDCNNNKYNNTASFKIPNRRPLKNEISVNANKQKKPVGKTKAQETNHEIGNKNPVILKFEKESDEVHKRCRILAKKAKNLRDFKKKRKCKVFANEIVQYSNVVTDNKSVSVRKQINEVIIHEYLPLPPQKFKVNKHENNANNIMKSYDLIHPVTNINKRTYDYKIRQIRPKVNMPAFVYDSQDNDERDSNNPRLTYESHGYNRVLHGTKENSFEKNHCFHFSEENSAPPNKRKKELSSANMKNYNKKFKLSSNKTKHCETGKSVFTDISQSSYSIHFTETESKSRLIDKTLNIAPNVSKLGGTAPFNDETHIGTTYTIIDTVNFLNNVDDTMRRTVSDVENINGTYYVTASGANRHLQGPSSQSIDRQNPISGNGNSITLENDNFNVVFVSNSQHSDTELNAKESIDPLRICETILEDHSNEEYNFIFDSINNIVELNDCEHSQLNVYKAVSGRDTQNFKNEIMRGDNWAKSDSSDGHKMVFKDFSIKNRRRFLPKGLSPIFENCNSKKVCDYEFDEDYFEENLYNNFAQDVQLNTKTFEPTIQYVKELASIDIERVNSKLNRQNTSLTFNGEAIKEAQVLGQVDHKFIATKIKDKRNDKQDYLVLFDQHAVHERIRLETNMAEFFNGDQWKSASLDGISLHLKKDDIVYLHNYKDKFLRLGLEWQIVNDTEVTITAIPEAIFGKNVRQVDTVLKSVKVLVKEVINMIKEQGGCVSLYPKSIMDLVFSEACRYAIMFGDALSKSKCKSLLNALSKCKTPFQCAHGRPVMAVLTDIKAENRAYKVSFTRVQRFGRLRNVN